MKSKNLLVLLILLTTEAVVCQSLEFVYNNSALPNNATITITDFIRDEEVGVEMTFRALLQNKTAAAVRVVVNKNEIAIPEGSYNTFCTMTGCFTSNSSSEYTIAAGSYDPLFYGSFAPVATSSATIGYTASVVDSFNDKASVTVTYQYVASGIETVGFNELLIVQNHKTVTLKYENTSDTRLRLYDVMGQVKAAYQLPAAGNSLSFQAHLDEGIYMFVFYSAENKYFAQKVYIKP